MYYYYLRITIIIPRSSPFVKREPGFYPGPLLISKNYRAFLTSSKDMGV